MEGVELGSLKSRIKNQLPKKHLSGKTGARVPSVYPGTEHARCDV